jgi:NAD(P)H-hydrate epimerase
MLSDPDPLPDAIYTTAQVRELDRIAIEDFGIESFELMRRAASAALAALCGRWPNARRLLVYCGAGNNGGDGYVLASMAKARGFDVRVVSVGEPARLAGDAARALAELELGVERVDWHDGPASVAQFSPDVVVDALLGTGLTREVTGPFADAIACMNGLATPVLALDVPSGLDADRGVALGRAVRADLTITFVGLKLGLFLGDAPDYRGDLVFADLAIPAAARHGLGNVARRLGRADLALVLERRSRVAHKGLNGSVLIVGGGPGMPGAVRLAAEAAFRVGAGLVYAAVHAESAAAVRAGRPEIICRAVERCDDLTDWLETADVLVLGPGLGRSEWAERLWSELVEAPLPLVLDADGLNLLAKRPRRRGRWVLTPHPGEAARLIGAAGAGAVQADRVAALGTLVETFGATVVLKGACSLVGQPLDADEVAFTICDRGNPGMSTAGTGDVLAGAIGGLAAQYAAGGLAVRSGAATDGMGAVVRAAVLMHALAGDAAAADGERGTMAGDLLPHLRRWANPT